MMKHILAPILLLTLLFPTFALGGEVKFRDLVEREGLFYKKFTEVPFTGKITGNTQGTFKDGVKDGPWVSYGNNGQLRSKGTYKNGVRDGPWVAYWSNGQLEFKGTYKDGEKDGPWVFYKEYGTVWEKYTGTFKDGVKVD